MTTEEKILIELARQFSDGLLYKLISDISAGDKLPPDIVITLYGNLDIRALAKAVEAK
jgi:hypothetical protein